MTKEYLKQEPCNRHLGLQLNKKGNLRGHYPKLMSQGVRLLVFQELVRKEQHREVDLKLVKKYIKRSQGADKLQLKRIIPCLLLQPWLLDIVQLLDYPKYQLLTSLNQPL